MAYILFLLFGIIVGFMMPVQSAVNTTLRGYTASSPFIAATISFIVGSLSLLLITTFKGDFANFSMKDLQEAPWWVYTGGVMGAIIVLATVILAPRLGIASMMTLIIMGQLTASVIIDHYGMFGLEVQTATFIRILGIIFIGVVMVQLF